MTSQEINEFTLPERVVGFLLKGIFVLVGLAFMALVASVYLYVLRDLVQFLIRP